MSQLSVLEPRRFRRYVIELGAYPAVNGRPALYVGSTSLSAEERFRKHLAGGFTSSRWVRNYGTRPRPDLVPDRATYARRTTAERAEVALRLDLEARGYRVFGASGRPMPRR